MRTSNLTLFLLHSINLKV